MGLELRDLVIQEDEFAHQNVNWCAKHVFVDFMSLYARRPASWPDVRGDEVIRRRPDGDYRSFEAVWCSGAYDTRYRVLVDDESVFVQVNPSRVDRPDNVFGFRFEAALQRVSDLMARHGCGGPVDWKLSRLDLTANVECGSPLNLSAYLQQLRYLEFAHCEKHVSKYKSVAWHNDAKRLHVYDKGTELAGKYRQKVGDDEISWLRPDKDQDEYVENLSSQLLSRGVARVELKLKKSGLVSRGLRLVGEVTQERLDQVFMKEVGMLSKAVYDNCSELSDAQLGVLVKWMQGTFDRDSVHRNTFSKYRKAIREATGYDIAAPGPISLDRRRKQFSTRTIGPEDVEGYVLPELEDLI